MPDQSVEDGGRPLGAPAGGARRAPAALKREPKLVVVTGPSGAGKGTLIAALVERRNEYEVAVSATTRPQRPGERDGRDYYFLSEAEFLARVRRGDFLEHVEYVSGYRYGTLRAEVDRILGRGKSCVLELETKGARAVRQAIRESVTIFVAAPSTEELERRLRERATESAGEIEERLELARRQTREQGDFDYTIVNDDLERALAELTALLDDPRREASATAVGEEPV